jgi:arginyl-tRNA synthetase
MIRDDLTAAVRAAIDDAGLPAPATIPMDPPRQREHGDWSTPVAMQLAKAARKPPPEIAQDLASRLEAKPPPHVERVEVVGGFVNFHLAPTWLHDVLRAVVEAGDAYGTGHALDAKRINLEFVSANPTGPLHAGGARWVAVGDAVANLLAAQGAVVHREYYLNDAGNQLGTFADSLLARFRGEQPPEDGYHGEYLIEMADRARAQLGDDVRPEVLAEWGYHDVVRQLREDLERIGVHFDTWFSERQLHARGDVVAAVEQLKERGHIYEADGAVWFNAKEFGDQRDRVIVTSDGRFTYLAADVAYHLDKYRRGWEHLIDIWGADHHGQVKSLQVAMQALGYPPKQPEIILGQLVNLVRGGQPVKLSKRTGDVITLEDILDEVDPDATRLTFLLQSIDTAQTFDLDVVTSQSMDNPVYYVQYAHARIASIGRKAVERRVVRRPVDTVDLASLVHERELDLLRSLATYPDVVADAAETRGPHKVTGWVREMAGRFHGFYHDCRVIDPDDDAVTQARLWLAEACRIGLANALGILGVSAPEEMARLEEDDA